MSERTFFPTLKKRREFIHLQKEGIKWITPSFVIQSVFLGGTQKRIGYITTRKLGSAVIRNRARRRLKEVIRSVFSHHALPGYDYVLIARSPCIDYDFLSLKQDMIWSLGHLHRIQNQRTKHIIEENGDTEA